MKTMNAALAFAAALGGALGGAQTADARLACYPLKQIEHALDAEYGEKQHFAGHEEKTGEENGVEYRLYVNAQTGSWSWVGVPSGSAVGCLIFAGRMKEPAGKPGVSVAPQPEAQF